jgi:PKD domain/Bacterial Ig domain
VTAVNDPPVVIGIPDQTILEGSQFATISLNNFVSDPDNTDAQMKWTYSGNTALTISIVTGVATITIPSPDWNGSETITFKATDPDGLWDDDRATFTVTALNDSPVTPPPPSNHTPIADASAGEPYQGLINTEIIFNGSRSYDNDNDIIIWSWDFGDNTKGTGMITKHTFSEPGVYKINLTVIDADGPADNDSVLCMIKILNRPPINPIITGPTNGTKNMMYSYTVVSTDADNDTIHYTCNWGDSHSQSSGFLQNGSSLIMNHTWMNKGRYDVTVTVTDNQTVSSSKITVYIDAVQTGDIGYLLDNNSDGIYDAFHNNTTSKDTIVGKTGSYYLIDNNGDNEWEYTFDVIKGLMPYQRLKIQGFQSILFIFAMMYQPVIPLVFMIFILISVIIFIMFWKRKRKEDN